jgi:hypothetical protein
MDHLGPDLLAQPPMQAVFHNGIGDIAAALWGVVGLAFLAWGLTGRDRRLIVPAMLLGGMCTSSVEPLLDVLTGCLHPIIDQRTEVFSLMGRSVPLWVVECYGLYYGGFGALNLLAFNRGITRRAVWLWFLAPLLGDILIEQSLLHYNLYLYYGNQALEISRFPLYQPAGNSVGELFGVLTLFFLRPALSGWRWFLAAVIAMPLCAVMGFNVVAWPTYYVVHSTAPAALVQACGVLTWVLAGGMVYLAALLVAVDSPLRKTGQLVLA